MGRISTWETGRNGKASALKAVAVGVVPTWGFKSSVFRHGERPAGRGARLESVCGVTAVRGSSPWLSAKVSVAERQGSRLQPGMDVGSTPTRDSLRTGGMATQRSAKASSGSNQCRFESGVLSCCGDCGVAVARRDVAPVARVSFQSPAKHGISSVEVCTSGCGPGSLGSLPRRYPKMPSTVRVDRVCETCGRSFSVRVVDTTHGRGRFCSRSCASKAKKHLPHGRGADNPGWKGGMTLSTRGYWYVWNPEHHRADKNGYAKRADLVMEEVLGRPLERGEIVHHGPGGKEDDSPENLSVMQTGEHSRLHADMRGRAVPRVRKPDAPSNRRYSWPSDDRLLELREVMSLRELSQMIGCGHKSVDRRIQRILAARKREEDRSEQCSPDAT